MITYSIIKKSQLEGAHRLDAGYYQPEYLENRKILERVANLRRLEEISAYITNGATPYHEDLSIGDIRFLTAEHIFDFFIDFESSKYIKKFYHDGELKRTRLGENDLLITIKGKIGNAAVIFNLEKDTNINQDVARVVLKKGHNPFYVCAFLNSKYGKLQSERLSTNQINPFLGLGNLKLIKIPFIKKEKLQEEVEKIIRGAQREFRFSKSLYSQAEQLLLEKLGIKDLHLSDDLFYTVSAKETKETKRFDAEYWQLKYKKLLSYLNKKFEIKKLRDLVNIKKGIEPGSEKYQEEGKPFIRVSNLSKFGINDNDQKYLTDDFYHELKGSYQPKMGEILLSKDATPGIAYVVKESIEGIIAGGILRLRVEADLEPEYLALIINSLIGQYQMERDTGGSVIVHWRPEQIRNICIPIIEKSTQQEIASLVKRSHSASKKAKELLEEAKQKVEKMIVE